MNSPSTAAARLPTSRPAISEMFFPSLRADIIKER